MPGTTGTRRISYREHGAICLLCKKDFTYLRGNGSLRKYCSVRCRDDVRNAQLRDRTASRPDCRVEDCTKKATRVASGYCETHFYRVRRNGTLELRPVSGRAVQSAGYHLIKLPDHPLRNKNGWVYTHRQVCHDKHNGECPHCYWCGKEVDWRTCHVDHLDDDKDNNTPENLEVACPSCNKTRGLLVAMFKRIKPERREQLLGMIGGDSKGNPIDPNHHWNRQ